MPRLPVNISGSFNYMINVTFSPAYLQWYDFALVQKPEAGRLAVRFETKKDQKEMVWNIDGDQLAAHDAGQAWIDTSSMQVARNRTEPAQPGAQRNRVEDHDRSGALQYRRTTVLAS